MSDLVTKLVTGLVRHLLTGVAGWLISNGILNQGDVDQLLAGLGLALITIAWSVWNKYGSHLSVLTALASPQGTTLAQLKESVDSGKTPPVTTSATSVPRVLALVLAVGLGALLLPSCGGTTQLPNLPQVQATTDKDVRASIAKAYQLIGAALNVLDHADQYEATINKAGGIPANVHQAAVAGVVKAAKDLDAVNTDIGNQVLTTYAAIKARVDPIIANLNTLLNLTKTGGFDWGGLLAAAINLLMAVTNPGFGGSGVVPAVS